MTDVFGATVVTDLSHPAVLAELDRLAATFDPNRAWVNPGGHRLSDRVWLAGQEARAQIDAILLHAIATGEDGLETARKLEVYLSPELQPVRDASGKLVRDSARNQRRAVVTGMPGRGGRGSYAARRLARTEIARAHAEATRDAAELNPFVEGLKYNLSPGHSESDQCDARASRENGMGRGVYRTGDCPLPPAHPHCRCYVTHHVTDDVDAVVDQLRKQYGLDEPLADVVPFPVGATGSAESVAAQAVPTIKTIDDLTAFFGRLGVKVHADTKSPAIWNTVARAYADQVAAGRPVPPVLNFLAKQSKTDVAAYTRRFDAKTRELIGEEMNIYQRNPFWKDETLARHQEESGWWSSGDPDGVVIHEFGHFEHFHRVETDAFNYTLKFGGTARSKSLSPTERMIANRVSHYGAQNAFEFVAETYTGIRKGKTYDDEIMSLYRTLGGPPL